MVAREAMAYGRPVIATAVGGLVDAVEDGVTGIVVPGRIDRALRVAMERLLADAELRSKLGAGAARVAGQRFSVAATRRATVALYDELTRSSGDAAAEQRPQDA